MSADLFAAAAERAAIASGRPVSQERLRVLGCDLAAAGPLFASDVDERRCVGDEEEAAWWCICGAVLASVGAPCGGCGR